MTPGKIGSAALLLTLAAWGCSERTGDVPEVPANAASTAPAPAAGTPEAKILEAQSAAPAEIAGAATILDWPAAEGAEPAVLREGDNGWTCFPTMPDMAARGESGPMCLDGPFVAWAQAYMTQGTPELSAVGFGYMLAGDGGVSNINPYDMEPTPDNQWVKSGPHLMMVVPNAADLDAITTDPESGGPFVMWKGTPYVHVMMPVGASH